MCTIQPLPGVSPSPLGAGPGEGAVQNPKIFWGAVPPPQKIFGFLVSKWWVVVHSGWYFLLFTCLFYTQKWRFWSSKTSTSDQNITQVAYYYPRMPIGKVWIYRLLYVCFSVCFSVWLRISTEDKAITLVLQVQERRGPPYNVKCHESVIDNRQFNARRWLKLTWAYMSGCQWETLADFKSKMRQNRCRLELHPKPRLEVTAPPAPSWNKGTPYALIRASGPRCGQRERREKPKDSSLRQADWFRDGSRSPSCRGLRRQGQGQ